MEHGTRNLHKSLWLPILEYFLLWCWALDALHNTSFVHIDEHFWVCMNQKGRWMNSSTFFQGFTPLGTTMRSFIIISYSKVSPHFLNYVWCSMCNAVILHDTILHFFDHQHYNNQYFMVSRSLGEIEINKMWLFYCARFFYIGNLCRCMCCIIWKYFKYLLP